MFGRAMKRGSACGDSSRWSAAIEARCVTRGMLEISAMERSTRPRGIRGRTAVWIDRVLTHHPAVNGNGTFRHRTGTGARGILRAEWGDRLGESSAFLVGVGGRG